MAVDCLLDQLTFYGSYHRDPRNKAVHLLCVPLIAWSVLVWLWACDEVPVSENALPDGLARQFVPTAPATLVVLAYAAYYASLDSLAGITWAICVGAPLRATSRAFHPIPHAWRWALFAHVLGWTAQIYPGHLRWEGRRPAVFDSAFQSLVLAPLFVWMEVLFACGYRPGLRENLKRRVEKAVKQMDAGRQGARSL